MNTKWDSVAIGNFTNSGHYDFTSNVLAEAKKIPAIAEKCATELTAMEAAVQEEDEALLHALKSPYTKELWDNDAERDRRYYNLSETARAMAKWPEDLPQAQAAQKVMEILDIYKVNPQAQVNKETGAMTNLLQELQGELAGEIEALGLTQIVTKMALANAEVNRIYNDRLWADSVKVTGRVAKARAEVDRCYMALREKVNALVIVFGPEDYSAFLGYVNGRIASAIRWQLSPKRKADNTTTDGEGEGEGDNTGSGGGNNTGGSGSGGNTGSGGGNNTGGSGSGGGSENTVTVVFEFHGGRAETITGTPGSPLTKPANTTGYMWPATVPATFPAENATYTEVEDNRQEYQITYMDANNEDEFDIQMVKEGDPITPPTPPSGYHWVDVPATMPARNLHIRCAANA